MTTYAERKTKALVMVEVVTSMKLLNLREFNDGDWMGFAGCEDQFGAPETFEIEFLHSGESCKFVADDNGVCLDYYHPTSMGAGVFSLKSASPGFASHYLIRGIYEEIHSGAENYTTWDAVRTLAERIGFRQL